MPVRRGKALILDTGVLTSRIETKVRQARLSDVPFIVNANACLALETEGKRLSLDCVTAGVKALLGDEGKGTYFIAEVDGEVAGQLLITREWSDWRNGHFWWVQSVYVVEQLRGAGVFRSLFNHVRALAKAQPDVCGIRLYMEAHNARARRAYERLGLKQTDYQVFETEFRLPE
jgi:GNAT superfamily N-acetyltransferase